MTTTRPGLSVLVVCTLFSTVDAEDSLFDAQVAPLLRRACVGCHDAETRKGRLDLSSLEALSKGGKNGAVIVRGKSKASLLMDRVTRRDGKTMPPKKAGKPLSDEDVAILRRWIDGTLTAAPRAPVPATAAPRAPTRPATDGAIATRTRVGAVSFSPDDEKLAVGGDGDVTIVDAKTGAELTRLPGHAELVRQLDWTPDGQFLVAAGGMPGDSGEVILWRTSDWEKAGAIKSHRDAIYGLSVHPSGRQLATASYDKLIKLWAWDGSVATETAVLKDHIDAVSAVAHTRTGEQVISTAGDRTLKVWNAADGARVLTFSDATKALRCVATSPVRDEVAAGGEDKMIRIWSTAETGSLLRFTFAHGGAVLKLAYTPDGNRLISTGEDGLVKVWDEATLSETTVMEKQPDWVLGLDVDSTGERVAVGRFDGSWAIYQTSDGAKVLASQGQPTAPTVEQKENLVEFNASANRTDETGKFLVEAVQGGVTVPPFLTSLSQRTAVRGATHTFELKGNNLADASLWFSHDGIRGRVVENEELEKPKRRLTSGRNEIIDHSTPHRLDIEVTIADTVPTGDYKLLALTPMGATNMVQLFVEAAVEHAEEEPNDTPAGATHFAMDDVTLGKMDFRGDKDLFRFRAEPGDAFVFHIRSTSLGSGLNALLELIDEAGNELARSDAAEFGNAAEARVGYRFGAAGDYFLRLTDRNFGEAGLYRLYGGRLPYVTSFFPPGLQSGKTTHVSLQGFNLGTEPLRVEAPPIDLVQGDADTLELPLPHALRGASLAVGELPDRVETEPNDAPGQATPIEAPGIANGVLQPVKTGGADRDHYRFQAKKGQRFTIDVIAARIGSTLDSAISVLDAEGRRVERAVLRSVGRSEITFRGVPSNNGGMRLKTWNELSVDDLVMVGSEVLRIKKLPDSPDENVEFFSIGGRRTGYFNTTPGFQPIGAPVYKVETHAPGAVLAPNGMPIVRLYYENDDGGLPDHKSDSLVRFAAPQDGEYVVRVEDVHGRGGPDFFYRLQIRPERPRFRLRLKDDIVNVPTQGGAPLRVEIDRLDGFDGPVRVESAGDLPAGFRMVGVTIPTDREVAFMTVWADETARSTAPWSGLTVRATAEINGKEVTRAVSLNMLRAIGKPDVSVAFETSRIRLIPGKTTKVKVRARRHNGFSGRIQLDVLNLPHGVLVLDTGLNGILLPAHEDERTIILHSEAFVTAQSRRIYVTGRATTRSPVRSQITSEPASLEIGPPGEIVRRAF